MKVINKKLNYNPKNPTGLLQDIQNELAKTYPDVKDYAIIDNTTFKQFGEFITNSGNGELFNAFFDVISNKIAKTNINGITFNEQLSMFKKGVLGVGDRIEEVALGKIGPLRFSEEYKSTRPGKLFDVFKPEVAIKLFNVNRRVVHPITIPEEIQRSAFTSLDAFNDFMGYYFDVLASSANIDERNFIKYKLVKDTILNDIPKIYVGNVDYTNKESVELYLKNIIIALKNVAKRFKQPMNKLNAARWLTTQGNKKIHYILDNNVLSNIDVNVVASSFNRDVLATEGIEEGQLDTLTLSDDEANEVKKELNVTELYTENEKNIINKIVGLVFTENFYNVYDYLNTLKTGVYNGMTLEYNQFLHTQQAHYVNPFAPAVLLLNGVDPKTGHPTFEAGKNMNDTLNVVTYTSPLEPIFDEGGTNFPLDVPDELKFDYDIKNPDLLGLITKMLNVAQADGRQGGGWQNFNAYLGDDTDPLDLNLIFTVNGRTISTPLYKIANIKGVE